MINPVERVITPEELHRHFFTRDFVKTIRRRSLALATLVGHFYGLSALVYATRTIFNVKDHGFGITGAPWTKGVKKGEVRDSVIIGGHKNKTEKVLQYLRRMYMPLQNYKDMENEFLVNYWEQGKDILGISNFGELVPEVVCLGLEYETMLKELIAMRIDYKLNFLSNQKKWINRCFPRRQKPE